MNGGDWAHGAVEFAGGHEKARTVGAGSQILLLDRVRVGGDGTAAGQTELLPLTLEKRMSLACNR